MNNSEENVTRKLLTTRKKEEKIVVEIEQLVISPNRLPLLPRITGSTHSGLIVFNGR
jgi:hypothetical protein